MNRGNFEFNPMSQQHNLNTSIVNQSYRNFIQVTDASGSLQYLSQERTEPVHRTQLERNFTTPFGTYSSNSTSTVPIQNEIFSQQMVDYLPSTVMTTHVQYDAQQQTPIQRPDSNNPLMIQTINQPNLSSNNAHNHQQT